MPLALLESFTLLRGEPHARAVQPSLEYDPAPPFDSGSPECAGEALVASYRRRIARSVPTRDDDRHAPARRRRF